jgi:acetyltransferase-like isoleucine patch superfamily enzyme
MSGITIHPTALVESQSLGKGTRIWAFVHVMAGAVIGRDCNIGDHCFIEGGSLIGDGVTVKNGCMIWSGVTIGDGVFVGPGVVFTNDRRPRSSRLEGLPPRARGRDWLVPTTVDTGASLGARSVVVAGVRIGAYAMVGAGAVVTRDVLPHALVIGNPARRRGWVCRCGEPLAFTEECATCVLCGLVYRLHDGGVECTGQLAVTTG